MSLSGVRVQFVRTISSWTLRHDYRRASFRTSPVARISLLNYVPKIDAGFLPKAKLPCHRRSSYTPLKHVIAAGMCLPACKHGELTANILPGAQEYQTAPMAHTACSNLWSSISLKLVSNDRCANHEVSAQNKLAATNLALDRRMGGQRSVLCPVLKNGISVVDGAESVSSSSRFAHLLVDVVSDVFSYETDLVRRTCFATPESMQNNIFSTPKMVFSTVCLWFVNGFSTTFLRTKIPYNFQKDTQHSSVFVTGSNKHPCQDVKNSVAII